MIGPHRLVALFIIMAAVLCPNQSTFAKSNDDMQALIVSADSSYVASEKTLEFSYSDSQRLSKALVSAGKVSEQNILNLKNPSIEQVDQAVEKLAKNTTQKFMFYFSGHSDEHGLHLKDGSVTKQKFHELLAKISAKVKIVVLDSCFSGALKGKGAVKSSPIELVQYNIDEPTGSVILTSSSGKELSYESDKLKGSIFTYHLVSGLYGQADSNNDGLVTIDELYQYVYAQTKFQSMVSGGKVQSPEFESKLTGQGALVVSYPARINGHLSLANQIQGELTFVSASGINFFKFYKNKGEDKTISLPQGKYDVTLAEDTRFGTGEVTISEQKTVVFDSDNLVWQKREAPSARAKGAQSIFLVGALLASHPAFFETEESSSMLELFLLSPSSEALYGRWRLGVYLGGESHKQKNSDLRSQYGRMTIGGEGNYRGLPGWHNEWLIGLRFGTFVSNNDTAAPASASLTHGYIGTRLYPPKLNMNFDLVLGSDTIKVGNQPSRNVSTIGLAVSY